MTSTSTPQPSIRRRSDHVTEHKGDETVPQAASTPIYSALARQWAAERKAVPGDVDQEWAALADYATWRRRQPRVRNAEL